MKHYEIYKHIRKRALIWGLPLSLFALQMLAILASLLVMIFSFSVLSLLGTLIFNTATYIVFTKITSQPHLLYFQKVFPKCISNKHISPLQYD